jgi:soluble lytic murein transglycosylase-like protein
MPQTSADFEIANPHHVLSNLMGACEFLRRLLNRFDLPKALAAYNAGPAKVLKYGGIPPYPETQLYVQKVLKAYERLRLR